MVGIAKLMLRKQSFRFVCFVGWLGRQELQNQLVPQTLQTDKNRKAIPTKTDLISVISFRELAKNIFLFSCPVSYGVTEFGTYYHHSKIE